MKRMKHTSEDVAPVSKMTSTVARALAVLDVFSLARPELGLAEIARITNLNKATALRLLNTLVEGRLLTKNLRSGLYRVGSKAIQLSEIAKKSTGFAIQARPYLVALRDKLNETAFASVRIGDDRIDVEQVESTAAMRRVMSLGSPKSLYIGCAGKIMLSVMEEQEIEEYLSRHPLPRDGEYRSSATLLKEISVVRRNGYASSLNKIESAAVASAPVFGPDGILVGTLTVTAPIVHHNGRLHGRMIDVTVREAGKLSAELGAPDVKQTNRTRVLRKK
jgi:DNA-binding IclR family transcriptional regulator